MGAVELILITWFVSAGLGVSIAEIKGRSTAEGFLLGLIGGPFGLFVEAIRPTRPFLETRGLAPRPNVPASAPDRNPHLSEKTDS